MILAVVPNLCLQINTLPLYKKILMKKADSHSMLFFFYRIMMINVRM